MSETTLTMKGAVSWLSPNFAALLIRLVLVQAGLCVMTLPALELKSPDGRLVVSLEVKEFGGIAGCPVYQLDFEGQTIITPSRLGFEVGSEPFATALKEVRQTRRTGDEFWKPLYGERSNVRDHYNEASVELEGSQSPPHRLEVTLRAYDEGLALCYTVPTQANLADITIARETTEFRFPADHPAWATYRAQGEYTNVPLSQIRAGCERPLVVRAADDLYVALAEARLVDYARMKFAPLAGVPLGLVCDLSSEVKAALPLRTPWRVVMVARSPARLLENNDLMLNLNEPCALTNTAWIKPGKVIRDKSLTTVGGKACVDFARKHNLQYILFDAGWYGPETSAASDARAVNLDPKRSNGPLDLPEVIRYGQQQGIGVILYVNHIALERQLDALLPLYRDWGVKGIKFGFVNVGSQHWTSWLHEAIRNAASYHLMVDVHDEYRPTGWARTYPNFMTAEGVRGDEERQINRQGLTTLFTRFLAGPADNTICYFDERVDRFASHGFQLAKAVCFYSPWQCLYWYDRPLPAPDGSPNQAADNNVIGDEPELTFFDHCSTVWDDTRVLRGEIGEYAILARRSGKDWYIGFMNANSARAFDVSLDFLSPGQKYNARIYSDDPGVPTSTHVGVGRRVLGRDSTLRMAATAQGGQAAWLSPVER